MRTLLLAAAFIFSFLKVAGQSADSKLEITKLTGDFYIYTSYSLYEGSKIPAHGMYLVAPQGVVLFDTPWDTTQFQPLLDSIETRHHTPVVICIATHWHSDRTAGLEYYRKKGIKTYTTVLTDELCQKNGKKRAEFLMTKDTIFRAGPYSFETYYPGEGHTADNIIIWFGKEKILYGGCLVKGVDAESLGFLGDANVMEYATTLRRVQQKCRRPNYIIVSHNDWTSTKSLKHSLEMAKQLKKEKSR